MTLQRLRSALEARSDISDWKVQETGKVGSQGFLIGRRPDLARSVRTRDFKVTVYVDGGSPEARTRGDASVSVHPTMGETELRAVLDRAVFAASRSRNPWYPLPERAPGPSAFPASGFEGREPEAWMAELRDALYGERAHLDGARVNSLELFLDRVERRVVNSRGADAAWSGWSGYTEFTVEASGSAGEVELTDSLSFSEPDPARLADELARRLAAVRDRAEARPTPPLSGLPLVLSGTEAEELLRWFFGNLDAARAYSKASPFEIGASIHGEEARPGSYDPLEIAAEPWLPGAPRSAPYDLDGFPLERLVCAEGGVARAFYGQTRYAYYLGLRPAGHYPLFSVGPGSVPAAEMRAAPCLEAAFFSDFNVDPDSGDFGGEIRLAYWNDGSRRVPVTGGSVTGSVFENRGLIRLARETVSSDAMRGPEALLLPRVSVTATG